MWPRLAQFAAFFAVLSFMECPARTQDTAVPGDQNPEADVVRLVMAAESGYFQDQGRYGTFVELLQSGLLHRAAVWSSANLRAFHELDLEPGHDLLTGFTLGLMVASEASGYKLSLTHKGEPCAAGWFADNTGALYEGKAAGCLADKPPDPALPVLSKPPSTAAAYVAPPPHAWNPPDIDQAIPPVETATSCPLPQILKEASGHAEKLVESLQRFSATEQIVDIEFRKDGRVRTSQTFLDNYVAQIESASSGSLRIEEYRSGGSELRQPPLADVGTAAFALIFHPRHIKNFDFRCEGLTELNGIRAWQVHFEESADPVKAFHAIDLGTNTYKLRLKGRAWIAADSYEVLQLETDLVSPLPQIALQMEHMRIAYAPVEFKKRKLRLWLPENATMYIAFQGHRYERIHNFRQFQLFWIDTEQTVKDPVAGPGEPGQEPSVQR